MSSTQQPAAIVYLVTNRANGRTYVGVTRFDLAKRWGEHVGTALGPRCKSWLHRSIRKYGVEQFDVVPIVSCLVHEVARGAEQEMIRVLRPDYNQTNGGEITVGRKQTPEVRARIAASNLGQKRTTGQRAKNSAKAKARYVENPKWKAEVLAALARGRANVDQEKRKVAARAAMIVVAKSAEFRQACSAAAKRRYRDPAERLAASLLHRGRLASVEQKRKMSESAKRRAQTQEGKSNVSASGRIGACKLWNINRNKSCVCGTHENKEA